MSGRVGIDLGGTQIKAALFDAWGRLVASETTPTRDGEVEAGRPAWAAAVRALVERWEAVHGRPDAIGLAAPGMPALDGRSIRAMPVRMEGLEGFDWGAWLGRPGEVPVLNDAHAAILGEAWQGAARGRRHAVMLTLGTGVGGAAIVDGRLLRGISGRGGHLGHLSLDVHGPVGILRTPGALEELVGECSLPSRSSGRFATTRELLAAVNCGDEHARRLWLDSIRALACAIASLINIFDPEIMILGGGVTEAGDVLWAPLERELDEVEWRPGGQQVPVVRAELGGWAGAYGAARGEPARRE
jgi:glucokinase